jgi:hypothetical protein
MWGVGVGGIVDRMLTKKSNSLLLGRRRPCLRIQDRHS